MSAVKPGRDAVGRRFATVASSFNSVVVERLVQGALACFRGRGIAEEDLLVVWTPGAFELPLTAKRLAMTGLYDAVVCLGAVIRGETPHFDLVAAEAASGIQRAALDTNVPVIFGVVTTETIEQALDRAGGKHGNKGWDSAIAAMAMASVLDQLPQKE